MKRQAFFTNVSMAIFLALGISLAPAQTCAGYERELEEYFYNFQPGSTKVNIRQVEMVYARCPAPTPKMSLIYYYLKSMDVWYASYLSDEAAYHDARFYYEKASAYFAYLVEAPTEEAFFVDLYFSRAQNLQNQLGIDYIAVQPLPNTSNETYRTRGGDLAVNQYHWKKYTPERAESNSSTYRTRGGSETANVDPSTLRKSDYRDGEYQSVSRGENSSLVVEGETYGSVGSLDALNAVAYLRFQKEWGKQTQRSENLATARLAGPSRGDETSGQTSSQTSYTGLICIYDNAVVRTKPGETASPVGLIHFGEAVARIEEQPAVSSGGNTYVSVRLRDGQLGWMVSHALVKDGRLAVITETTKAYLTANPQTARDRNMIIFLAGELVVLEGVEGDYIRIVSRDAEKRAWVFGIGELSIDEFDIAIGKKLYEASRQNSVSMRKAILQSIRTMPGFEQSALADDVMEMLENRYTMR